MSRLTTKARRSARHRRAWCLVHRFNSLLKDIYLPVMAAELEDAFGADIEARSGKARP